MTEIDQIVARLIEGEDFDDFDFKEVSLPTDSGELLALIGSGTVDPSIVVRRTSHHSVHERSTEVQWEVQWYGDDVDEATETRVNATMENLDKWLSERMVDWNRTIYRELEREWDSRLEEGYIIEEIEANEWKFDEDGTCLWHDEGLPFEQLSPEAKETAIEQIRQKTYEDPDTYWSEFIIEEWKKLLQNKGFDDVEIAWSGFSSQGDGASFTGRVKDWNKFLNAPDPLDIPEQDRGLEEAMEDDDDLKDLLRSDRKPFGWVLRSTYSYTDSKGKIWPSPNPWLNARTSDFRKYLGDATVFKRFSTTKQWPELEAVPVYDDPRKYGDKVLDPAFEPKPSHRWTTLPPQQENLIQERYGGAERERALFYHGTSAALIPRIMSEGLIPDPKVRAWAEDPDTSILQGTRKTNFGIGLTRNLGSAFLDGSRPAKRDNANTAIICVVVQPRSLIADEDDVSSWVKHIAGHLSDSVYHHIWPYFMEVYRQLYKGYRVTEAMDDEDDMSFKDVLGTVVTDHYTEAADKQKREWIDSATQMLLYKFGKPEPRLEERIRQLLDEEGYAAMLTRAVAYTDAHNKSKWESEWRDWFGTAEPPPIPDKAQAEEKWLAFVDKLSATLKDYTRAGKRKSGWKFDIGGRGTQRIGFKGSNRIVCIVERTDQREPEFHSRMLVHFGEVPQKLIKDWTESVGPLKEGDIVYKNQVRESDEDFKDIIKPPRIFVRWVWTSDVDAHLDRVPRLYQGEPYQHSNHEQGPFLSYESAYEWARANLDARDHLESLDLIQLTDDDTVVAAHFITGDWEMKRFGEMPDGTILGEAMEEEDIPATRFTYLVREALEYNTRPWVQYFLVVDPSFQPKPKMKQYMLSAVREGMLRPIGGQSFPKKTKTDEMVLTAEAQIRAFLKTPGVYDPDRFQNVWDWMKEMRKPQ